MINIFKIEIVNLLGVVELDNKFKTYEEAKEFAIDFSSKHCSVLNIDIIEYNPSEIVDNVIENNSNLKWLKELI